MMPEGERPAPTEAAATGETGTRAKQVDTKRRSPDQWVSLLFRFLQLASSVISFVVLLKAGHLDLDFRRYQAFRYLLAGMVITAAWSLLMLLIELLQLAMGRKLRSLIWRGLVYLMDILMALVALSAGAAAAAVTTFNDRGIVLFNYAPCVGPSPYTRFCSRTKASTAFAFITFFFFLPHILLSAISYFIRFFEAAAAWQPSEQGANEICSLLHEYLKPGVDQARIFQELQRCSQFPDFNNYLAFLLCKGENQPVEVRQSAGLLLKNNLRTGYENLNPAYLAYIKSLLLPCIGLPDHQLRATVGTVISCIVEQQGGLHAWTDLLQVMLQCLDSNDFSHMEGALDALFKMSEDMPLQLDRDIPGLAERPITVFLPRLLQQFASPHASLRKLALGSVNQFILHMPRVLLVNMDSYLQGLFALGSDPIPEVRRLVCSAVVQLIELQPSFLQPHMRNVIEYMLASTRDSDPDVALEACEFWSAYCENNQSPEMLREFLPQLVTVLLTNMVYADDDEAVIDAEDEGGAPDSDQDLKPRFHQSRLHGANGEDAEEDYDESASTWNLRKCSAAGLDILSHVFGDALLPVLMPLIQTNLADRSEGKWKEREASVLAVGAVAEGCIDGLLPALPQMIAHLLPLLEDPHPLVRSITCWTLSRYSKWIARAVDKPEGQQQFDAVLTGFLARILDNNKRVQEAACSAFATLEEEAVDELPDRLEPILQHLAFAFSKYQVIASEYRLLLLSYPSLTPLLSLSYPSLIPLLPVSSPSLIPLLPLSSPSPCWQRRNLRILYDAVGTLADCVGGTLQDPRYIAVLMPPLTAKWQQISDFDRDIFPLLECFTSVAQALGPAFAPYAETVLARCCHIIRVQLVAQKDPAAAGAPYDKEFIVCALDLSSGVVEGLGPTVEPLIAKSGLTDLLLQCCAVDANDIKQSSLALLGDLTKSCVQQSCVQQVRPRLNDFLSVCVSQLNGPESFVHEKISVANNACWALGELAVKVREEISPAVVPVLNNIVPVLTSAQNPRGTNLALVENCAITLGRFAWVCPDVLAPQASHFLVPFLTTLKGIRDDVEKEEAFKGLCAVLRLNPMAASAAIHPLLLLPPFIVSIVPPTVLTPTPIPLSPHTSCVSTPWQHPLLSTHCCHTPLIPGSNPQPPHSLLSSLLVPLPVPTHQLRLNPMAASSAIHPLLLLLPYLAHAFPLPPLPPVSPHPPLYPLVSQPRLNPMAASSAIHPLLLLPHFIVSIRPPPSTHCCFFPTSLFPSFPLPSPPPPPSPHPLVSQLRINPMAASSAIHPLLLLPHFIVSIVPPTVPTPNPIPSSPCLPAAHQPHGSVLRHPPTAASSPLHCFHRSPYRPQPHPHPLIPLVSQLRLNPMAASSAIHPLLLAIGSWRVGQ
ncbi:unnamed protein product [Closterium sp. Yama58-4]|nr:unnamed protein product [Closterium sp. Yama58-4]